jgi:hypothetical protein
MVNIERYLLREYANNPLPTIIREIRQAEAGILMLTMAIKLQMSVPILCLRKGISPMKFIDFINTMNIELDEEDVARIQQEAVEEGIEYNENMYLFHEANEELVKITMKRVKRWKR